MKDVARQAVPQSLIRSLFSLSELTPIYYPSSVSLRFLSQWGVVRNIAHNPIVASYPLEWDFTSSPGSELTVQLLDTDRDSNVPVQHNVCRYIIQPVLHVWWRTPNWISIFFIYIAFDCRAEFVEIVQKDAPEEWSMEEWMSDSWWIASLISIGIIQKDLQREFCIMSGWSVIIRGNFPFPWSSIVQEAIVENCHISIRFKNLQQQRLSFQSDCFEQFLVNTKNLKQIELIISG